MKTVRVCLTFCLWMLATPARADDAGNRAREHFRQGTKAYDLQRYLEAAQEYEAAYQIKDEPALLFNIGQAYRLGGDTVKALGAYRSFLRRLPDANNRAEVLALIDDLRRAIEAQKQTREKPPTGTLGSESVPPSKEPARPPESQPQPPPPKLEVSEKDRTTGRTLERAGLGVGSAGLACVVVGFAMLGLTVEANDKLNHPAQDSFYDSGLEHTARTEQLLEGVFLGVGAVAVVTGVGLYVAGAKRAARKSLVIAPGPGLAGASLAGSF